MKSRNSNLSILITAAALALPALTHAGESPEWINHRPSNSGIPGLDVSFARFDPIGTLHVGAREAFWFEGGVGVLNGDTWTTYANFESPIPSDRARDITFTETGEWWLATWEGLVHYDGETWTIYNSANSPLPANVISHPTLDSQERIWMTYRTSTSSIKGVAMFDGEVWSIWPHTSIGFLPTHSLAGFGIDANDNVWVGTAYGGGSAVYDGASWTHLDSDDGYSGAPADVFTLGADGKLWTDWCGVCNFDGDAWTFLPWLGGTHDISAISALEDGTVWIGTYGGVLAYFNGATWSSEFLGGFILTIEMDQTGRLWVGTQYDVHARNDDGSWTVYNGWNTGMPDYFIRDIMTDSNGRIWMSSGEGGASVHDGTSWRNYGQHNEGFEDWPFLAEEANRTWEDANGDIWLASNGVGRVLDNSVEYWDWTNSDLPIGSFVDLDRDANGTLWTGESSQGLFWFDGAQWHEHLFDQPGATVNWIEDIETDADGNMWVATFSGLFMYDGVEWIDVDDQHQTIPVFGYIALAAAPNGDLWAGTKIGLYKFDGDSWTNYTSGIVPAAGEWVTDIDVRDDGLVAVTSVDWDFPQTGGVSLFDGDSWTTFTPINSALPHFQVEAVQFDASGHLWVGATSQAVVQVMIGADVIEGDLDGDGVVGFADLLILLANWGQCASGSGCHSDLDDSGDVGFADLLILLGAWE